jgi:hypothetical protein
MIRHYFPYSSTLRIKLMGSQITVCEDARHSWSGVDMQASALQSFTIAIHWFTVGVWSDLRVTSRRAYD